MSLSRAAVRLAQPWSCAEALAALPKLWNGEIELQPQRRLRAHLLECAQCKAEYVRGSELTSAIARDGRVGRLAAERRARRNWLQSLGRQALAPRPRLWVRTLVVPALVIVLLSRQPPAEAHARVEAQAGGYRLGERMLAREHRPQRVRRGDLIVAEPGSRVRLFESGAQLSLLGPGAVCVESTERRRYRLGEGAFEARGRHTLTTAWALVELTSGVLELELSASGGSARLRRGVAELVRAEGACLLVPGEPIEFGAGL